MVLMNNIETMLIISPFLKNIILIITNKNNVHDTYMYLYYLLYSYTTGLSYNFYFILIIVSIIYRFWVIFISKIDPNF